MNIAKKMWEALKQGMSISLHKPKMADKRYVYGAMCTWHGSISEVKVAPDDLPACPHCNGMLYEMESEEAWWQGVDAFEKGDYPLPTKHSHEGYHKMLIWQREQKTCFQTHDELCAAYLAATGIRVDLTR